METKPETFPRKFGSYHLLSPLAKGGMGALYLATTGDRGLEKLLVIKTVLPQLADTEYLARFRDEAKIVVRLSHGNLVPVFDAGEIDGEVFLAMDFIEGRDLRATWNRCAQKSIAFPIEVAVHLVKELCRGLDYAHNYEGLSLVHRDVSPPNVLLSYSGGVRLTDFGLALSTLKLEKTAPGIVYGKVSYMSPEQARGEKLDGRSDQYAAAIILWELLTGRQLFPPGTEKPKELLLRAKNPRIAKASSVAKRIPSSLDKILSRALRARPDDRYPRCGDFRDALGGWLAQHAPTTDATSVEHFLTRLFTDDMALERRKRKRLLESIRRRVKTKPPGDELRQLLISAGEINVDELEAAADRRKVEVEPETARRMEDASNMGRVDRRMPTGGRRVIDKKIREVAWVPAVPAGGQTVVLGDGQGQVAEVRHEFSVAPKPDLMGQVLDERYRIEDLIGEGGMGRVYGAEHIEIGRRVAIKVLHPMYSQMPELVERFRREARAASRIGHPNIVEVTDSGTTADGSVYFVMELLEGSELAQILEREGALDVKRALRIAAQICRALSAAHRESIVHRDLKPENIFLTVRQGTSDFVKVLDFGIAKSAEAEQAREKKLTHPGMAMGTPEYMAPEQAAGKAADARCDIYAVGAILYEMLSGRAPYQGANFMEILSKKATVEPEVLSSVAAGVRPDVEQLVSRSMARAPGDRPPTMEALEYELMKCLSGRGDAVLGLLGVEHDQELYGHVGHGMPKPERRPEEISGEKEANAAVQGRWRFAAWGVAISALLLGTAWWGVQGSEEARAPVSSDAMADDDSPLVLTAESAPQAIAVQDASVEDADAQNFASSQTQSDGDASESQGDPNAGRPSQESRRNLSRERARALLKEARIDVARLNWKDAEDRYRRIVEGGSLTRQGYLGLAQVAFQQKRHEDSIAFALKAGHSKEAKTLLGHAYFRAGDFESALLEYEAVLKRFPDHRDALRGANAARDKLRRN